MSSTDHIIIFFTPNAQKINMADIADHGSAELKMIEVPAGKQSADIHIGSYLGYLAGKAQRSIVIISKDTDFDKLVKFWKKELGISVSRKQAIQESINDSKSQSKTQSIKDKVKLFYTVSNRTESVEMTKSNTKDGNGNYIYYASFNDNTEYYLVFKNGYSDEQTFVFSAD